MAKILVFDPDAEFRAVLGNTLTSLGYEAVLAKDGYDVLSLAEQNKPALVVLDYKLPEAAGFDILKRLRATKTCASTPIIFVSATPKFEIEMTVMDEPLVGYVDKPLDVAQLKAALLDMVPTSVAAPAAPAAVPKPMDIPPPGAPLGAAPAFTGEADLDGGRDEVIDLD